MKNFFSFWTLSLVLKLIVTAMLPFSSDEAYYWVWSTHLQWSYFDHPGMIAWLLKLGHVLDPWGLRWPVVTLGHLSWIFWYLLFQNQLKGSLLHIWILFMLLNPLFGWGGFLAIPDTPAIFFSSLASYAAFNLVFSSQSTSKNAWALLLGIALGLGFNSKYHIVLFVPSLLIWVTWIKAWRRISTAQISIVLLAGIVFSFPVLYWNYLNNFDSFIFQLKHGLSTEERRWVWPIEYLGSQVGLLFPTVFFLCLRPPKDSHQKLLYSIGWFTVLFFVWSSFSARPEGNWPILGYAPLLTLACLRARSLKILNFTATIWILAFLVAITETYFSWLPIKDKSNLKTSEFHRFDEFLPYLDMDVPVYASSFQMAATLHFKTRKPVYKLKTLSRRDHYDYLSGSNPPQKGHFAILANRETNFGATILNQYVFVEERHFSPDKKLMIYRTP